jgi:glycosyltransferase involved in cell wall biosynthesis
VLLRDQPLFSHVIPSKMFEAMGSARAVILGVRGESKEILERAEAGIPVPPENTDALVQAILDMANNPDRCRAMGIAGRRFVENHYNRDTLAQEMLSILEEVHLAAV